MKLEPIIQSEVSQKEKHQYSIVIVKSLSCAQLFATPWTAAHQAPPSMGFSRQEYWSGVLLPSPKFRMYLLIYWIGVFLSDFLRSV